MMSDAQDIKKLMQNVKLSVTRVSSSSTDGKKELDSPYAKYNSRGQLMCIVCGTVVKSKIIWQAHINKRSHKENLLKLLEKQHEISSLQYKNNNKRVLSQPEDYQPEKKLKPNLVKPKGILKNFNSYSSSDEESDEETVVSHDIKPPSIPPVKKELESDYMDVEGDLLASKAINNRLKNIEELGESSSQKSTSLPEGFFDDPVADAKARHVEYVDKDEEEWLTFMKEVSAAEVKSMKIIAEDKEEAAIKTQLEQVTEQIRYFERLVEIDRDNKNHDSEPSIKSEEIDSDMSSDEEFAGFNWRSKNSIL